MLTISLNLVLVERRKVLLYCRIGARKVIYQDLERPELAIIVRPMIATFPSQDTILAMRKKVTHFADAASWSASSLLVSHPM